MTLWRHCANIRIIDAYCKRFHTQHSGMTTFVKLGVNLAFILCILYVISCHDVRWPWRFLLKSILFHEIRWRITQLLSDKWCRSAPIITNIDSMTHHGGDVIHRYFNNEKATELPKKYKHCYLTQVGFMIYHSRLPHQCKDDIQIVWGLMENLWR